MLPTNVISALQILSRSDKPLTGTATDAPNPVTKLEPGQQLRGSVQSKVSEGLFKVQVAGQVLQMRLPGHIRSGDTIKLEVISTQPRITFGIVASTNPLSTPEQIGATARILSNLAGLPLERPIVQQLGNKAVWDVAQPAPDAKLLAGALRDTLGNSGLFYESHQAQWVRGGRSTNQLLKEPQNVLMGRDMPLSAADQHSALDKAATVQAQQNAMMPTEPGSNTPLPVARELLHLVQQQLHTLEHHHLAWMGQVWPGQQMQWEIQGKPEQQSHQQDERQWSTEMELALPSLGGVYARLVFAENGLQLALRAADSATVDLFNRNLPKLKNSLADAGIVLAAATVEKS